MKKLGAIQPRSQGLFSSVHWSVLSHSKGREEVRPWSELGAFDLRLRRRIVCFTTVI